MLIFCACETIHKMITVEKIALSHFKLGTNKELVREEMTVLNKKNLTLSSALRLFLQNVGDTNKVDLLSEEVYNSLKNTGC